MSYSIGVSILCTAYNHEKYIKKCLEGFIMQKTSFAYEVIVNDDASTDNTASIIRQYSEKYPDLIKPIFQESNQYSNGVKIASDILFPKAQGKYIAMCEGDDYWSDPNKLQYQYDALENNQDCHMCVCKTKVVKEDGSDSGKTMPSKKYNTGVWKRRDFLDRMVFDPVQTSSFFMRSSVLRNYYDENPAFRKICMVGDFTYRLYFGCKGDVFYIEDILTCYRQGSSGSISRAMEADQTKRILQSQNMIDTVRAYDVYTNHEFSQICKRMENRYEFMKLCWEGNYSKMLAKQYREPLLRASLKRKLDICFSICCPHLYSKLKKRLGLY